RVISAHADVVTVRVQQTGIPAFVVDQGAAERRRLERARRDGVDHDLPVDVREKASPDVVIGRGRVRAQMALARATDGAAEVDDAGSAGRAQHTAARRQEVEPPSSVEPIVLAHGDVAPEAVLVGDGLKAVGDDPFLAPEIAETIWNFAGPVADVE